MNVITSNPIIEENDFHEEDWYNLFGEKARRRRANRQRSRQRRKTSRRSSRQRGGGGFFQKAGQAIGNVARNVSQSGILDTMGGMGQGGMQGGFNDPMLGGMGDPNMGMPPTFMPTQPPRGLSRRAKIAIGVGVAAALGVGIYFLVKKGKKKS